MEKVKRRSLTAAANAGGKNWPGQKSKKWLYEQVKIYAIIVPEKWTAPPGGN